jgi:TatD DNase family protein
MSTPLFFDIHTHTQIAAFKDDQDVVIKCALDAGVWTINVGTQSDTSRAAVVTAARYEEGVYATVGLHPIHTVKSFHDPKELETVSEKELEMESGTDSVGGFHSQTKGFTSHGEQFDYDFYKTLAMHPKVVAIGECGLDYYRLEAETAAKQKEVFIAQIELANEVGKPLMLHIRPGNGGDAYLDALEIVKSHAKVLGNVHFFVGSKEDAQRFFNIGYTVSFTGVITFTHDYDEVVAYAPLSMLHAETDAPYVTPVPRRGTRNEPLYVQEVVKQIAEIKNTDLETVRLQLRENARRVFGV